MSDYLQQVKNLFREIGKRFVRIQFRFSDDYTCAAEALEERE